MDKNNKTRRHTAEFRERAVRLFREQRPNYNSDNAAFSVIAPKLGCSANTLRAWYLRSTSGSNQCTCLRVEERARIMEQELENLDWQLEVDDGFIGHVGGLWHHDTAGNIWFAFIARPFHANRNGVVHGGMLMTFIDRALGRAAQLATGATRGATISLSHHFLAPVKIGDLVKIRPEITKVTKRMVFVSGTGNVADSPVFSAQGVFRVSHSPILRPISD